MPNTVAKINWGLGVGLDIIEGEGAFFLDIADEGICTLLRVGSYWSTPPHAYFEDALGNLFADDPLALGALVAFSGIVIATHLGISIVQSRYLTQKFSNATLAKKTLEQIHYTYTTKGDDWEVTYSTIDPQTGQKKTIKVLTIPQKNSSGLSNKELFINCLFDDLLRTACTKVFGKEGEEIEVNFNAKDKSLTLTDNRTKKAKDPKLEFKPKWYEYLPYQFYEKILSHSIGWPVFYAVWLQMPFTYWIMFTTESTTKAFSGQELIATAGEALNTVSPLEADFLLFGIPALWPILYLTLCILKGILNKYLAAKERQREMSDTDTESDASLTSEEETREHSEKERKKIRTSVEASSRQPTKHQFNQTLKPEDRKKREDKTKNKLLSYIFLQSQLRSAWEKLKVEQRKCGLSAANPHMQDAAVYEFLPNITYEQIYTIRRTSQNKSVDHSNNTREKPQPLPTFIQDLQKFTGNSRKYKYVINAVRIFLKFGTGIILTAFCLWIPTDFLNIGLDMLTSDSAQAIAGIVTTALCLTIGLGFGLNENAQIRKESLGIQNKINKKLNDKIEQIDQNQLARYANVEEELLQLCEDLSKLLAEIKKRAKEKRLDPNEYIIKLDLPSHYNLWSKGWIQPRTIPLKILIHLTDIWDFLKKDVGGWGSGIFLVRVVLNTLIAAFALHGATLPGINVFFWAAIVFGGCYGITKYLSFHAEQEKQRKKEYLQNLDRNLPHLEAELALRQGQKDALIKKLDMLISGTVDRNDDNNALVALSDGTETAIKGALNKQSLFSWAGIKQKLGFGQPMPKVEEIELRKINPKKDKNSDAKNEEEEESNRDEGKRFNVRESTESEDKDEKPRVTNPHKSIIGKGKEKALDEYTSDDIEAITNCESLEKLIDQLNANIQELKVVSDTRPQNIMAKDLNDMFKQDELKEKYEELLKLANTRLAKLNENSATLTLAMGT